MSGSLAGSDHIGEVAYSLLFCAGVHLDLI